MVQYFDPTARCGKEAGSRSRSLTLQKRTEQGLEKWTSGLAAEMPATAKVWRVARSRAAVDLAHGYGWRTGLPRTTNPPVITFLKTRCYFHTDTARKGTRGLGNQQFLRLTTGSRKRKNHTVSKPRTKTYHSQKVHPAHVKNEGSTPVRNERTDTSYGRLQFR